MHLTFQTIWNLFFDYLTIYCFTCLRFLSPIADKEFNFLLNGGEIGRDFVLFKHSWSLRTQGDWEQWDQLRCQWRRELGRKDRRGGGRGKNRAQRTSEQNSSSRPFPHLHFSCLQQRSHAALSKRFPGVHSDRRKTFTTRLHTWAFRCYLKASLLYPFHPISSLQSHILILLLSILLQVIQPPSITYQDFFIIPHWALNYMLRSLITHPFTPVLATPSFAPKTPTLTPDS